MTFNEKIYDIFSGGKVSYKNEIIKTRNENLQLINDFIGIANKDYPELKGNRFCSKNLNFIIICFGRSCIM